ncbi:MAG TPA: hypothetical protein VK970_10090 [Candidatus Methylacidiphilales bacterium]|nr:hypothetical protein [Candidatus Methylacidiphilales bacterium]
MKSPETSRLFTRWRNPASGVESLILSERLAPVQKSLYYINRSFTNDGRYLWVSCMFVPKGGRLVNPVYGVVDFERDEFRLCHETQSPATAAVDLSTGELYWINGLDIWKRGPLPEDEPIKVNRIPLEISRHRYPEQIATHMTFSADGKSLNLDARFFRECYIGEIPLDGSPVRVWEQLPGVYNHAQFSPTDPNMILFANEYWQQNTDIPFDGSRRYHRMWVIRRGEGARPVLNEPVTHSGHEWWDADGRHVWYLHYGIGVKKVVVATGEETLVWSGNYSHSHSDRASRYLVSDAMADPVISDCHVVFYNNATGKTVEVVNRPPLDPKLVQCGHLHPHPQFCMNDRYICHTTTVHDRVDIALVPTDQLMERTQ